ncbi:MAG TPA: hypothetical protein VGL05_02245, partial [Kribbella sp.]
HGTADTRRNPDHHRELRHTKLRHLRTPITTQHHSPLPTIPTTSGAPATAATPTVTTAVPTVARPYPALPTVALPTIALLTIAVPTAVPTVARPYPAVPTVAVPTVAVPTVALPATALPTTALPAAALPASAVPATADLSIRTTNAAACSAPAGAGFADRRVVAVGIDLGALQQARIRTVRDRATSCGLFQQVAGRQGVQGILHIEGGRKVQSS